MTGHTEKVALRFKKVFEKMGWECDLMKIDEKADARETSSHIDLSKYDFLCVGSYVQKNLPSEKLIDVMRGNPQSIHYGPPGGPPPLGPDGSPLEGPPPGGPSMGGPDNLPATDASGRMMGHRKIILGPENQKGIVFVSFAGHEFGFIEAEPALALLKSEMDHLKIVCLGRFACPGKFGTTTSGYFRDIKDRPHERDLLKAEIFLEEILEAVEQPGFRE
jgi:hypothetical protein